MTINSTLPISLGGINTLNSTSSIQGEFGGKSAISLSEYYKAGPYVPSGVVSPAGSIPTAGAISMSLFRGATDNLTDPAIKPGGAVDLDLSVLTGNVFTHTLTKTYVNTPSVNSVPPKLYFQFWRDGSWSTSVDSNQQGMVDGLNVFTETWGNWIEPNNYSYGPQHWIRYHINSIVGNGTNSLGGAAGATGPWVNGASNPQCWIQLNDINVGATYVVEWLVEMSNNGGTTIIDSATFQLQVGNNIKTYLVEYLIVASGGAGYQTGGAGSAGAGGAGGVVLGSCQSSVLFPLTVSNPYGIYTNLFSVGPQRNVGTASNGTNGTTTFTGTFVTNDGITIVPLTTNNQANTAGAGIPSYIGSVVAFGGGGGIGGPSTGSGTAATGRGGSGAGCGQVISKNGDPGGPSSQISYPAFGGVGYGNAGGRATSTFGGGGGGGAGGTGGQHGYQGDAGDGLVSSITGQSVEYARGGPFTNGGGINDYLNGTWGGGGSSSGINSGQRNWRCQRGNSGIIVLAYPSEAGLLNVSGGLTYTLDTTTRAGYNVYKFTGGTDIIEFPLP